MRLSCAGSQGICYLNWASVSLKKTFELKSVKFSKWLAPLGKRAGKISEVKRPKFPKFRN
ncbi:hypothetical protein ACRRTK_024951 [Alexandromys fortis]